MIIDGSEVYLFNPWQLQRWTEQEICMQVNELMKRYDNDADTMYEISSNVEILSNINYLYGEMISRLASDHQKMKLDNNSRESKLVYELRNDWVKVNKEKPPAITYFEAQAYEKVSHDRKQEVDKLEMLNRFKYAYDSNVETMNAMKKKIDSIKYEQIGG